MKHRRAIIVLTLGALASFAIAPPLRAQGMGAARQAQQTQQDQKPSLQNPAPQTPAAPKTDPKEEAAYKAFYEMKPATPADYTAQIQAGEDFVKNYPQSRYCVAVYPRLTNAYFEKQDLPKMYAAADKALQLNPNDISVLTLVGWVIPRGDPSAPDFADKLGKAEQYEKHALELLPNLPKPTALTDDEFAKNKASAIAQAHSGLGLVYFREGKNEESSAELAKATDGSAPPDPTDYFVLGVVDEKLSKFADAAKAFEGCSQIQSQLQDRCKQGVTEAKAKAGNQLQPPKP